MTDWFPSNKRIFKAFTFHTLGWTLIAMAYGVLSIFESILLGLGAGTLFTLFDIARFWINENIRKKIFKKYEKSKSFKEFNFRVIDGTSIFGEMNQFKIRLTPTVKGEYSRIFELVIDLSIKPHLSNHINIKRTLNKTKFELNHNELHIPNWNPNIWNLNNFDKIVLKISKLLNQIEGK